MSLAEEMKKHGVNKGASQQGPVWQGPHKDGITFSLLSRYLVCKERFRIYTMEGWRTRDRFAHRMEYGNMWHVCEEDFAEANRSDGSDTWKPVLRDYVQDLCKRYPTDQEDINKWYNVCKVQFPEYIKFWANHPDVTNRTPLLSEQIFSVPYVLSSGRTVLLRGKWDSVDLVEDPGVMIQTNADPKSKKWERSKGIWLQENKSKGEIDQQQIERQLTRDMQTMLYLVALGESPKYPLPGTRSIAPGHPPILGVRYNVIRRPLSGGKGTIVRGKATQGSKCPKCKGAKLQYDRYVCPKCKGVGRINAKPAETEEAYYKRVAEYIKTNPQDYFMRWNVGITSQDISTFKRQCLDPILENLCDDYEWWSYCCTRKPRITPFDLKEREMTRRAEFKHHFPRHFLMPFGIWNPLLDNGSTELDEYIRTGSTFGLQRVENLFPELA